MIVRNRERNTFAYDADDLRTTLAQRYDIQSRFETPELRRMHVLSHVFTGSLDLGYHDLAKPVLADIRWAPCRFHCRRAPPIYWSVRLGIRYARVP